MKIKKSTLNNLILISALVIGIVVIIALVGKSTNAPAASNANVVTTENGKQVITITARGGYFPSSIQAKANQETILRIVTNSTFDCSSGFRIPALGISKNLPPTGKTDIVIPAQAAGSTINATCTMGMYNLKIKFDS